MKTLIALDIDCVLLPWDDDAYMARQDPNRQTYDRYGKGTGFKDWRKIEAKFFTFISEEQHSLIPQVGDVHWLTTWGKHDMTDQFTELTGFGPWPVIRPQDWSAADHLYRWWKMGWLYMWVRENHEHVAQYDRVLWVDDDHYPHLDDGIADVAYEFAQLGTELISIKPQGSVWSREEIEQWLPET